MSLIDPEPYGARINFLPGGDILVRQTVLHSGVYRVHGQPSAIVKAGANQAQQLLEYLHAARQGKLAERNRPPNAA
jgi:hypothetical protein